MEQAEVFQRLGMAQREAGNLKESTTFYRAALKLRPGDPLIRYGLAWVLLQQGLFEEGFPLLHSRLEVPALGIYQPALPFPVWRGEDVRGRRLLIWGEQGFGDQIMLSRFALAMHERGALVTLVCTRESLRSLFEQSFPFPVVTRAAGMEFDRPDCWSMLGSVPGAMGATDVRCGSYITADRIEPATGRMGLVWRGGAENPINGHRSMTAEEGAALADALDHPISLHMEDTGAETFLDTARIIAGLDLVVSVDTAVAHLAAAMGKPCWVLLSHKGTDWRWMRDRSDSPWYPSARLYRQGPDLNWTPVIEAIRDDLAKRYAGP